MRINSKFMIARLPKFILICILLLGSYLRINGLANFYFWGDEALHINLIPILDQGLIKLAQTDAHPPFLICALKTIISILGVDSPIYFRLASLVSGILMILLGYYLGKDISQKKWIGLFTAYLIATSPFLIEQSQLVRSYGLLIFFLTCTFYLLFQDLSKTLPYLMLLAVTFFAAASHYSFFIIQPGLLISGYLAIPGRTKLNLNWKRGTWIGLNLFCLIGAIYLIKQFPKQFLHDHISGIIAFSTKQSVSNYFYTILHLWIRFFGTQTMGAPILTFGFFFGGIIILWRLQKYQYVFFILVPYLLSICFDLMAKYPLTSGRHSSYLFLVTFLPAVYFISESYKRSKTVCLCVFVFLVFYQIRNPKTVFNPNNNRWAWGEETYSFNVFAPLSLEINRGRFLDHPIILDGGDVDPIVLEKTFLPRWGLFNTEHQRYYFCNYMELKTKESFCRCLNRIKDVRNGEEFYVLFTKLTDWRQLEPLESSECFTTAKTFKISNEFSISAIRKKSSG